LEFSIKRFRSKRVITEAREKWPEEMVVHAHNAANLIHKARPSAAAKLYVEQRVTLSSISNSMFGTLDYAWVEDWGWLVVIDYKYGRYPVHPRKPDGTPNRQLMYYALGLVERFGWDFDGVILGIIQPRAETGDYMRSTKVPIGEVKRFAQQVKDAVRLSKQASAPLVAGDHCKFCPAAPICPEISRGVMKTADIDFDFESGVKAVPEPSLVDPRSIAKMLKAADLLEVWIKAVRERAFMLAKNGKIIEGYSVVPKRPTRVWLPGAQKELQKVLGDVVFGSADLLSPAQLEKIVGVEHHDLISKLTTAVSSGDKLVATSGRGLLDKSLHQLL
jgi:hypothetical protein